MKWNASAFVPLMLLAACGGGAGFDDFDAEVGPPPQAAAPRLAAAYAQPAPQGDDPATPYGQPGASYAPPGGGYAEPVRPPASARAAYAQDMGAPPPAEGPQGSSQQGGGELRYDEIGYAAVRSVAAGANPAAANAIVAVHGSLPRDSVLEVTSLETGRTILVLVTGTAPTSHTIDLSPGAARLLGIGASVAPVRVRRVVASAADMGALRQSRPASERPDAPPVLLTALRKHLPAMGAAPAVAPPPSDALPGAAYRQPGAGYGAPGRPARAPAGRGSGYFVQAAALSNAGRAQALADQLGGFVRSHGGLHRVQLGPFASEAQARAARGQVVGQGFPDATILFVN